MIYITNDENHEYLWNSVRIIDSCDNDLLNLKNNIYLINVNYVQIFYIKVYNYLYPDQLQTRNEVLFSYYLKNPEEFLDNKYYSSKVEKCCEFCFKVSKNITQIIDKRFNDVIICKPCLLIKKSKNYHVNDRLFKSTNNINIEIVKKIGKNIVYFYSTQQYYDDFNYFRLLNLRYYQILQTKLCQFCHKNKKSYDLECYECRKFSLDQYRTIYIKTKYFGLIDDLHTDIINVITKLYIILHNFDKREFINYYDKINKKDEIVNIDNSYDIKENDIKENNIKENDIEEIIVKEEDDLIYYYESDDEYIDPDLINCDDDNDECDLTNFDDY